jgi:predicted hydrocarbon binding protein
MSNTTAVATEKPLDKRIQLIWGQKGDRKALDLLVTPTGAKQPDLGMPREKIRVAFGQQVFKHNHYYDDQFYRHDAQKGVLTNVYGQRLIRVSEDFLVAVLGGLEDELGDAAGEVMYKVGYEWGMEDMKSFTSRVQAEFELEMNKMSMGLLMETWWWPLQIEGWGGWHYDLRQGKQGLIFIDLFESAVAQSVGDIGKVVCHFYAGMFAAVFTTLAKRQLAAIEIQCYGMGEDFCKFLISTDKRVNAAAFWRSEGATSKDIMKKISEMVS